MPCANPQKVKRACWPAPTSTKRWRSSLGLNRCPRLPQQHGPASTPPCSPTAHHHGDYSAPPRSSKTMPAAAISPCVIQQVVALNPTAFRPDIRVRAWDRRGRLVSSAGHEETCSLLTASERLHLRWNGPASSSATIALIARWSLIMPRPRRPTIAWANHPAPAAPGRSIFGAVSCRWMVRLANQLPQFRQLRRP